MSTSSALSRSAPPEPTAEEPALVPSIPAAKASAEPEKKRLWSVRPRTIDPVRREKVVAGRPAVLCVDNISVSFDGFKALTKLTLILDKGELRCLIGPNGAGKTTLMDVITGKTKPDSGTVFLTHDARDLTQLAEYEIADLGICRKFQRPTVFAGHTVYENLELALQCNKSVWSSLFFRLTPAQKTNIEQILQQIGLHEHAAVRAGQLAHGQKQWLEIARGRAHRRGGRARHGIRAQHRFESDRASPRQRARRGRYRLSAERPARNRGLPRGAAHVTGIALAKSRSLLLLGEH